ncbi:unnamed protein product [Rotaria sordida]|uniref:ATP-dependent DNA helicase n=1 Tax=Rotaria sordida TaxID=392033 RepID=A0A815EF84_9BILA|nr:unnamed protein product [Rotaria sordida]CAF1580185.1 unnamed protein product [Rotaria sordida]
MRTAKEEHEKYHDCFVGDTICSSCYDFIPKDHIPFCPHSRFRNIMEIPSTPMCLKLGFLEQRAIALMHCYISILIIRGHQSAMKGQVVHCQVDVTDNIGDLLPLPKCYEFMAVIQQKPMNENGEIKSTVRYSVSAIQILRAIQYLIQHHIGYMNKQVLSLEKIEEMFQCRKEDIAPIRIIDSYAYNNSTTSAPIILDVDEAVFGPSRTLKPGEDPIWTIQPGMEECTFPWIYPTGEGGELHAKRPIPVRLRDYSIGKAVRGTAAFWSVPRKILRSMYATLSKPNIFLSINLQDDVEFLTHIDPSRFGNVNDPNYDAIDSLPDDDYLQLVNENSALVARMCHRRMLAFEKFISDKKHPFFIDYIVTNYFFKIEFQRGGLPHLHTLLWLDNFPSIDTLEGRESVIKFIDKFLTTCLPDKQVDPEGSSKVRIRRGRKFNDEEIGKNIKESQIKDINKNYLHENEIYEQVDPNDDPDLLQLAKEKKEFFERLGCRFGSPFELANETHFRTYKEARILTRDDRDIIVKRLSEESRRIIPYNLHFLKTFRCNHDIQVITDPWASAEYLFSYVSKDAHMEKNLVYQMSNCTCSSLAETKAVLLKTGNAILSHRQVGKVEASWTVLGIPLYHSSMRCKSLYISLPWEEERILKRGRTHVTSADDFVESLTHRYVKRPFTPAVIDHITLFEFLTWFDYDRSSSMELQEILHEPLIENPLWRTEFNQPPLLKTSTFLPRIILSCGSVLIQHKEPACISFTCRYDDSMLAMYSMLSIGIPYRDPIEQFLGGKLENDLNAIHQLLLKSKRDILQRFSTLPGAYKIQMINAVEHLCDLNAHDFVIKPRTSFIFTTEDEEDEDNETINNIEQTNDSNITNSIKDSYKRPFSENIDEDNEELLHANKDMRIDCPSSRTEELLLSANTQQLFLANFFRQYLVALIRYEDSRYRSQQISKPLPFHIIVNGLAGSGKSYVISIIEQMLTDFCISESATRNRPRRAKGLLKMAHTGKAALNIHGWTIHTALGMRPDNTSTPNNAPSFKIHSIRKRLGDLILIIIDEISLVSYNLFQKVNKRLNQIFEVADKSDVYFGNIPVLLFGDLAQCEPVAAKQIFWRPSGETFSLWSDLFRPINFNINMRQGEDRQFFDILCRMRLGIPLFTDNIHDSKVFSGEYNEDDEMIIKCRSIRKGDNPLHYKERLSELQSTAFENAIYAFSKVGMARSLFFSPVQASNKECKINLKPSDDENECASMFQQLPICIGARVICRRNIDFDGEMVNGTEATIKDIIWDKQDDIVLPMSNRCVFPNSNRALTVKLPKYIELELDNSSIYKMTPEEVSFKDQNGIWMTRKQYPLSLGYAITVHRSQCMTYNKLVVDLTGINWKPEWCLSNSPNSEQTSARISNTNNELISNTNNELISNTNNELISNTNNQSISNCINTKQIQLQCMLPATTYSVTKPEHVIICEQHQEHFCGRHALRALSQRLDLFTDKYLFDIAEDIAVTDQIHRNGQPL